MQQRALFKSLLPFDVPRDSFEKIVITKVKLHGLIHTTGMAVAAPRDI
jgi:hypothetical protein